MKNLLGKMIDLSMTKEFNAAVFSIILVSVMIFAAATKDVEAGKTKTLATDSYKTELGTLIEVVRIPGFGKCMLTSVDVICEEE